MPIVAPISRFQGRFTRDQVFPVAICLCRRGVDKSRLVWVLIEKERSIFVAMHRTAKRSLDEPNGGFKVV